MSSSDRQVIGILTGVIIIYIVTWIVGLKKHQLLYYISFLNILSALTIIIYWIQHEMRIVQHSFDAVEISIVCFEALAMVMAVLSIFSIAISNWVKLFNTLFSGSINFNDPVFYFYAELQDNKIILIRDHRSPLKPLIAILQPVNQKRPLP